MIKRRVTSALEGCTIGTKRRKYRDTGTKGPGYDVDEKKEEEEEEIGYSIWTRYRWQRRMLGYVDGSGIPGSRAEGKGRNYGERCERLN